MVRRAGSCRAPAQACRATIFRLPILTTRYCPVDLYRRTIEAVDPRCHSEITSAGLRERPPGGPTAMAEVADEPFSPRTVVAEAGQPGAGPQRSPANRDVRHLRPAHRARAAARPRAAAQARAPGRPGRTARPAPARAAAAPDLERAGTPGPRRRRVHRPRRRRRAGQPDCSPISTRSGGQDEHHPVRFTAATRPRPVQHGLPAAARSPPGSRWLPATARSQRSAWPGAGPAGRWRWYLRPRAAGLQRVPVSRPARRTSPAQVGWPRPAWPLSPGQQASRARRLPAGQARPGGMAPDAREGETCLS
jgi:hypothetical protein